REVQRIGLGNVAQLPARRVADRILELDDVGAHPCQQLAARGTSLDMRHVQDSNTLECFHYFFFPAVGLRLVMRPLSVPAVSSIAALMSVGRFERRASS